MIHRPHERVKIVLVMCVIVIAHVFTSETWIMGLYRTVNEFAALLEKFLTV